MIASDSCMKQLLLEHHENTHPAENTYTNVSNVRIGLSWTTTWRCNRKTPWMGIDYGIYIYMSFFSGLPTLPGRSPFRPSNRRAGSAVARPSARPRRVVSRGLGVLHGRLLLGSSQGGQVGHAASWRQPGRRRRGGCKKRVLVGKGSCVLSEDALRLNDGPSVGAFGA